MATKLFVGGLAYRVTDDQLRDLFAAHGTVRSAQVIIDKYSNQSKGFGFVEMDSEEEARAAIKELNGKEFEGRTITVNEARPQEKREPRPYSNNFRDNRGGGGDFRNEQRY